MIINLMPPRPVLPGFHAYSVFGHVLDMVAGVPAEGLRHHVEITEVEKIGVESGAVKDWKEPLYVDEGHFNSKGYQIIAHTIITQLAKCGFLKKPDKS